MKKIITLCMTLSLLIGATIPAQMANVGDVIGTTRYTDIVASINDYNIASFNFNDYTAVVAEDLANYGFLVNWEPTERALYISRHLGNNKVNSTYIAPAISKSQIGKPAFNVLYSDIKTYINGQLVTSYNINGKTIIYFDDLSIFGDVSYYDSIRRLDLDIRDGLNYKISPPEKYSSVFPSGLYFEKNSVDGLQIRWSAHNNANKTINYYTTTFYMFNAVGDFAYDRWGKNYFQIKTIGPVKNGDWIINFTGKYEAEVYDAPCSKVFLHKIDLEYDDGTKETIYYNHIGYKRH